MIRCIAIAAAGLVNLELERSGALVLAALDLGAGGLQVALAEAVLHGVHDWILAQQDLGGCERRQGEEHDEGS